ncbi:MAG: O-antigen ligase family protein [Clostridia bacterium]|nr:O-antigen ligase family protein [Clostridia bacterium]
MDTRVSGRRPVQTAAEAQLASFKAIRNLMVIFVLLVFLGFPGTLSKVVGSGVSKILEYLAFGLQFVLVMLATGNDVMSIKLVNLQPAYWLPYLYVVYVVADSLLVTNDRKTVVMTLLHLVLTVMFALWLVEQFDMEELMNLFYNAQFLFIAITLISTVLFSRITFYRYQGSNTFRGLFATKNECGTQLSFGIIVQLILLRMKLEKKERISILFIVTVAVQFIFMLLTKNMGALMITFACIGYVIYYSLQNKNRKKKAKRLPLGILFVVVTVGFLFFALTVLQALEPFLNSLGKDASLTGRVPIWKQSIAVMQRSHTVTGYGLEMFWKTPSAVRAFKAGFDENSWAATSAASTHNMLVETWCNIGLLGLSIYFLMFVVAGSGVKHLKEDQYLFSSCYLVMFTVRSLTERQSNPSSMYALGAFVVLAMMYQAKYQYRINKRKKARVYVDDGNQSSLLTERDRDSGSDLAAFQRRFSNIAEQGAAEKHTSQAPVHRRTRKQEPKESINKLESLLREFDDQE